ncbi:DUF4136 domain-containing protein [Sphingomonas sp. HITSZ_GF]|uniref:DUF4136 domain-containing protein n=1 Tax=Sphingomonas sp. HITSZ_GF TaxID=3037247 RepID=UPI00240D978C|nr:DUF4136 domain-containing protein [Sphingomonas sp. HITSZ_GF]MDG2534626.1 DUF4136 domain-containing protein [Sphingomonas sp. HITSZ_GF]
MKKPLSIALLVALGACAPTYRPQPIDVTRYHLGAPMERTTVAIEPMANTDSFGPEYQTYADAVRAELERLGYVQSVSSTPSGYIAAVAFRRVSKGAFKEPPPVTIGVGGGSFSGGRRGGVGVGGDVGFGIGGKTRELYQTELWVQLRRRSDNTTVWEGRAQTDNVSGTDPAQPAVAAARMAKALFKDFPGESGITITVK